MQNFVLPVMTVKDNVQYFKENSERDYVKCIQDLIKSKPFGDHVFYIFSFVKRVDDAAGIKKMYHQPRLTKPEPVPGTTLMKVNPKYPEEARIIWTLPHEENFNLYKLGKAFSDPFVYECIETYLRDPTEFMLREPDDLTDEQIKEIYEGKAKKAKS